MQRYLHCKRVLVVTELFNISVSYFYAKESARCRRVLVVTELVISRTQCKWNIWWHIISIFVVVTIPLISFIRFTANNFGKISSIIKEVSHVCLRTTVKQCPVNIISVIFRNHIRLQITNQCSTVNGIPDLQREETAKLSDRNPEDITAFEFPSNVKDAF